MIVVHFDVIATQSDRLITRQPSQQGRRLWNTFFDHYKGRMVIVADEGSDMNILTEWLKRENFKPSYIHIADSMHLSTQSQRAGAVWWVNSHLGKITWYMDTDPECCSEIIRLGISTLLVAVPDTVRPEWSERQDIRSWDSLVQELDAQALKKAEKGWNEE